MIRRRLLGAVAAVILAVTSSIPVTAQDVILTPEGADWTLSRYLAPDSEELATVPFGVQATLRLDSGMVSGNGGCNTFSGSYAIDGTALSFPDELTRAPGICEHAIQDVEDAYLAVLPGVAGWTVEDGVLGLTDGSGEPQLLFEIPDVLLTATQFSELQDRLQALQTELDLANERIDNSNITKLRDRIKALEAESKTLKDQLAAAQRASRATPKPKPPSGSFSQAEKVLLKGIPARIANHCSPWRRPVPTGTVAAVRCTPDTTAVTAVFYYLMEASDAHGAFESEMSARNVPSGSGRCADGRRGQERFSGFGPGFWIGEGCDHDAGPGSFVVFVTSATDCKQLNVAGQRLRDPAYYITLQGDHNDIARVDGWAKRGANAADSYIGIAAHIPTKLKLAPACKA